MSMAVLVFVLIFVSAALAIRNYILCQKLDSLQKKLLHMEELFHREFNENMKLIERAIKLRSSLSIWRQMWKEGNFELDKATMEQLDKYEEGL